MEIEELLEAFDVYEKNIIIDGVEYPYLDVKYMYKNNQFARWFIMDFISNEIFEEFVLDWMNFDKFLAFERTMLEEKFFSSKGDERYNLYLIFIVKDDSNIYKVLDILKDFKYARKLVLNREEAKVFFDELLFIRRMNDDAFISEAVTRNKYLNTLKKSVLYAETSFKKEMLLFLALTEYKEVEKNLEKLTELMELSNKLEKIFRTTETEDEAKKRRRDDREWRKIDNIEYISVNNFRCYEKKERIQFAKVNLIYGENGVGKTSLLEAIELGLTGVNKWDFQKKNSKTFVEVSCRDDKNNIIKFNSNQDNVMMAEQWYGITVNNKQEFNELFRKWNYFDTSWASSFAIDGENQIELLQQFLGIKDIENGEKLLKRFYRDLKWISEYNRKKIGRKRNVGKLNFLKRDKLKFTGDYTTQIAEIDCRLNNYRVEIESLNSKENSVSWDDLLNIHLNKIEKVFKFLISSNEYKELKVKNGEIVAVRNNSNEMVSMSKMSTGQKVCLALAFMFSLYMSSDTSPNIIMLDEPVANLDDYHMLNLLDLLRRLALSGTQIFFTTANPDVAKLFRRKFSFLETDFKSFTVTGKDEIRCESYLPIIDEPIDMQMV